MKYARNGHQPPRVSIVRSCDRNMSAPQKPIFLDDSGRRWKQAKRLAMSLVMLFSIVGAVVAFSIFFVPMSPLARHFADPRVGALFGSVPVVPGALGAWRVSVIRQAGGYCSSTLAEDTDLAFRVRLLGYQTITENEALAFTEAPGTPYACSPGSASDGRSAYCRPFGRTAACWAGLGPGRWA
jgi:hypothetical protein